MSKIINLLAIDTATDACSVAICFHDHTQEKVIEQFEIVPRGHTRLLLPLVDAILKEVGISIRELDAFAFGQGPGSFTGVRIACSVIQGLSFGVNKPVVPVSTLRALAQGAFRTSQTTQVLATLDARLGAVYWGLFKLGAEGIMQPVSEAQLGLKTEIHLPPGNWETVTGYPHAQDIARIAVFEYQQGNTVSAVDALPIYLRDEIVKK